LLQRLVDFDLSKDEFDIQRTVHCDIFV